MIANMPSALASPTQPAARRALPHTGVRMSEVIAALSYALDITEGQPEGHAVRSCLIGMRLAEQLDLDAEMRSALFYALLLKDLGCSSNAARVCGLLGADDLAAKQHLKTIDWTRLPDAALFGFRNLAPHCSLGRRAVQLVKVGLEGGPMAARQLFAARCDRGAEVARMLDLPDATIAAIRSLDEHWNGRGAPLGLRGENIPLLGRIVCLAQTVEIFARTHGVEAAYAVAAARRGQWFDPALVDLLRSFQYDTPFWRQVLGPDAAGAISALEPAEQVVVADDDRLDRIAQGFAHVIDAKSPWTYHHSTGVAEAAVGIAMVRGFAPRALRDLNRAALLHDIGKLGVSNLILDKRGPLSTTERATMQQHAAFTQRILSRVTCFRNLAHTASAHHERLDGSGYPDGLCGGQLSHAARVLAVADVYDALAADRPYRPGMAQSEVIDLLRRDADSGLCAESVEALEVWLARR